MTNTTYKERLRVLLILYFFSEPLAEAEQGLARIFRSEVKIQKIDFLIRYPSYLCYELLRLHEETGDPDDLTIRQIISSIFQSKEPEMKTDEMRRFFYGAYEELDEVISYLSSVNFVVFRHRRSAALKNIQKEYFLTDFAVERITSGLAHLPAANWYFERCRLIKQYFGEFGGSELKNRQYAIDEYRDTPLGTYIRDIELDVRAKMIQLFNLGL